MDLDISLEVASVALEAVFQGQSVTFAPVASRFATAFHFHLSQFT